MERNKYSDEECVIAVRWAKRYVSGSEIDTSASDLAAEAISRLSEYENFRHIANQMNIPTESIHVRQVDYTDLGAHPLLSEDPSFANGADIGLLLDDDGLSGLGIGDQLSTDNKRKYSYIVTGIVSAIIVAFSWVLFTIWTYIRHSKSGDQYDEKLPTYVQQDKDEEMPSHTLEENRESPENIEEKDIQLVFEDF
eukprot:367091_1